MLLLVAIGPRKFSKSPQVIEFLICKMILSTRTEICIFAASVLALMESIWLPVRKTNRFGYVKYPSSAACAIKFQHAYDIFQKVWDIQAGTIRRTFTGHEQDIYSLDFSRNGKNIASGSGDRTVRVWNMDNGREELNLSIDDGVTTVAMSPDGQYVAAGSLDKSVRVWEVRTGYLIERLDGPEGHKDSVYSVAFAPNGRDLVSGSLDKTIKMWELGDNRGMMSGPGPRGGKCIRTFEGHKVID